MFDQLLINMSVHFTFFRRNKLLKGIALLITFFIALFTIPILYRSSSLEDYDRMVTMFYELTFITYVISASLGIFIIADHLRDRNLKMVLTKPCLPEVWLGSVTLSSAAASFVMFSSVLLLVSCGNTIIGTPFNPAFLYVTMYSFFSSAIVMSYLMFLGLVMRPTLAVLFVLLFSEGSMYGLYKMTSTENGIDHILLFLLNKLIYVLYICLPATLPFSEGLDVFSLDRNISSTDWAYLTYTGLYALVIALFFYFVSDLVLRRKRLI